jgi:hypothetical protein
VYLPPTLCQLNYPHSAMLVLLFAVMQIDILCCNRYDEPMSASGMGILRHIAPPL